MTLRRICYTRHHPAAVLASVAPRGVRASERVGPAVSRGAGRAALDRLPGGGRRVVGQREARH